MAKRQWSRPFMVMLAGVVCMFGFAGCSGGVSKGGWQQLKGEESQYNKFPVVVDDRFESVKLEIDVSTTKGSVSWTVVDPTGDRRLQHSYDGATEVQQRHTYDPIPGEWYIEVYTDQAEGQFDIRWKN